MVHDLLLVFLKVFLEETFNSVVWYHTGFIPVITSKFQPPVQESHRSDAVGIYEITVDSNASGCLSCLQDARFFNVDHRRMMLFRLRQWKYNHIP